MSFTARIRWQSDSDPSWELETRHDGFTTPEDAALYANGFADVAAVGLSLRDGRLALVLTDGSSASIAENSVQIWRLPESFDRSVAADDGAFQDLTSTVPLRLLSDLGLDGEWIQLAYGVLGPRQEAVDVVLELDETGGLQVTVMSDVGDMADADASFLLGVVPKA